MALLDGLFENRAEKVEGFNLTVQQYRDLQHMMRDKPFSEFKKELDKYRLPIAPSSQTVPISRDAENLISGSDMVEGSAELAPIDNVSLLSSLVNEIPIENPMTEVIKNNNVPSPTSPPIAPQYTQTTPITRPDPRPMPEPSSGTPKPSPTMPKPSPTMPKPNPTMPKPNPTMPKPSPTMPKPSPAMPKPSPAMSVRDVAKNNNMKKVDEYQSKTDQLQAAVDKLRRK